VMARTLLSGTDNSPLYYELESALQAAGGEVVKSHDSATATLTIHAQRSDRRVLSVDELGRASEYELSLRVVFSMIARNGQLIVNKESLRVVRAYSFDPDNVLGSGGEEAMLQDDMVRDAAQRILRRLQSQARTAAPASTKKLPASPAPAAQ